MNLCEILGAPLCDVMGQVTCRDWFQLTLKEGLTVYRDQEFTADLNSRPVKRIRDVARLRTAQFKQDAGPMAHPIRPDSYIAMDNFYTVRRMLHPIVCIVCMILHSTISPMAVIKPV